MTRHRSITAIGTLVALAACGDPAGPAGVGPADVPGASYSSESAVTPRVTGSGHSESPAGLREFTFRALETAGGDVLGSYKVVLPNGLFFEADVTCVSTDGNIGWVGGIIRASNAGVVVIGSRSMFFAIDGGEGAGAEDIVSIAVINGAEGADLAFCAGQPLELPTLAVTQGNVQVR